MMIVYKDTDATVIILDAGAERYLAPFLERKPPRTKPKHFRKELKSFSSELHDRLTRDALPHQEELTLLLKVCRNIGDLIYDDGTLDDKGA